MTFSILGSGFGLYGYLPALIRRGQTVLLPERYRAVVERRDDLRHLVPLVQWRADDAAIRREATACVISRRPADQFGWLEAYARTARAGSFILEKPLASSPASALRLLQLLAASRKSYRIAYTFRFQPWAAELAAATRAANGTGPLEIAWRFRAHHYLHAVDTWKRQVSEGGGALRFYGIHLIGLLAELGYREVTESHCRANAADECESWSAVLTGPALRACHVVVDSNSDHALFQIVTAGDGRALVRQPGPFADADRADGFDGRVAALEELCDTAIAQAAVSYPWYARSVELWDMAERAAHEARL